ncbi:P27 family phage terminase small subunit [Pseudolactococcus carnosus]|uniref:P27 family phage terminase small subunit n=1 Tax=Pseudolactococcus carnosus TaxID=2749961 RepID=A0ABT0AQW2_9LACT|nr:P27 family phage terminase small subunit [Lactococcus carnosus]MCJ1989036.1 P27 family phage terminase small subunit [Lactococcus carnosus]
MKKIPAKRTIYDYTIKQMKELKVHNLAYNRLVDIYSGMIHQYYTLLLSWEEEGCPSTVESAAGSLKKHPSLDQMEKLRKDILSYSNQLMLNPKSNKDLEVNVKPSQADPFNNLFDNLKSG